MICRTGVVFAFIVALLSFSLLSTLALFPSTALAQTSSAAGNMNTEDDSSQLPWRGTTLAFAQSLNVNTFLRDAQKSYNPTYSWSFIMLPRWYFNKTTFANMDQRLYLELTDSDSTLYSQRAMLSDTILGVDTVLLDEALQGDNNLTLAAGGHLIAPTSLSSRADTMIISTRARASATLVFKRVLRGASIHVQGRYAHRFLRHNTTSVERPYPCLAGGVSVGNCEFLGSTTNVRDAVSTIISASLQLNEKFSVEMLLWFSWSRGSGLATYERTIETGTVVLEDESLTHWRNERYFVLGANWEATDWLSLGLSVINYFPEKGPSGKDRGIANPLDMAVGLTTSLAFDRLYLSTLGPRKQPTATAQLRR